VPFGLRKILIVVFFSPPITWLTRGVARLIGWFWNEVDQLEVNQQTVRLRGLHPAFAGYRLTQISDIHMDYNMTEARLAQAIDQTNASAPDAIVITGDFVSHFTDERYFGPLRRQLRRLHAPDGIYAVLGNHDHVADAEAVRGLLREVGIVELANAVATITKNPTPTLPAGGEGVEHDLTPPLLTGEVGRGVSCASLHIAGVDDPYYDHADLPRVIAALPGDGAAILLSHVPDFADEAAASGRFGLQLSGHTHAGQVGLRFLWPVVLPYMSKKYPVGRYEINGMTLYTNRGLGSVHIPLRINAIPEITVFTLEASQ